MPSAIMLSAVREQQRAEVYVHHRGSATLIPSERGQRWCSVSFQQEAERARREVERVSLCAGR